MAESLGRIRGLDQQRAEVRGVGHALRGGLTWKPTTIIRSANLLNDVSALRDQPGGDIYVYGSVSLVRALLAAELVDELVLMIEPITLGGGKTLFPNDGEARGFELISARTANTGVQVCRYQPER